MVEKPPPSKEVPEFKFKLFTRLKIFSGQGEFKLDRPNKLVAVSSKYSLIFVGTPEGIQCIRIEDLSPQDDRSTNRNVTSYKRREFSLGTQPSHIDVSCDSEHLAITIFHQDCAVLQIFSIKSCTSASVQKVCEVRLSNTPGVKVSDLQWNPGVPNMIAVAMADGSAAVIEFKDGSFNINSIPQNAQASCLCWSPKGKQVVIGARNGSLTQYKPELKAVKTFPPPQMGFPLAVVSVHWVSNFQFIAAYKNITDPSSKSHVFIVNVPKNAPQHFVYYEDICFESDTLRPEHYFIHQQTWNIIFVATTNSMETSVLKMEGENWIQYTQEEGSRPELPLTDDHKDVFNLGLALDTSYMRPIVIGDKLQCGPMPLLVMYAHNGVLCLFHVINILPSTPSICQPPEQLQDTSGLHLFTIPSETASEGQETTKPESSNIPEDVSPRQTQPAPSGSDFGLLNFKNASSAPQSLAQVLQVSSSSSGLGTTSGSPHQAGSGGALGQNIFSQAVQGQTSSARSAVSQPQFGLAHNNVQASSTFPSQPYQPLSFPITQAPIPSQSQYILTQSQIESKNLQAQLLPPQSQEPSPHIQQPSETKPASNTTTTRQPVDLQLRQSQPPSQSNQTQALTSATKPASSPLTSSKIPTQNGSGVPTSNTNSVQTGVPAVSQGSQLVEETTDKNDSEDLNFVMGQCQEAIKKFNKEMDEKQRVIKTIVSRTEQNIQKSSIKDKLIKDIEILRKFEEKLKEYSPDQAQVNALGSNIMEMFGWYEKIKARERKNSSYMELIEAQDLDPVTKNYLQSIDKHFYYLESQIKQAKAKVGALWDNLGSTLEIPVMEAIYQSLVAQHNILAAKKNLVELYENKLKKINSTRWKRNNRSTVRDFELSTLADRLLATKLGDSDLLRDTSLTEASNNYIILCNKNAKAKLSEDKVGALHAWHKRHKVIKTKIVNRTALVQTSFLKDSSFNGDFSPTKQSTPYVISKGTPKIKPISSAPRKSLFTLTSVDDEHTTLKSPKDLADSQAVSEQVCEVPQDSLDENIKNNLISGFSKVTEGNKIETISDLKIQDGFTTTTPVFQTSSTPSAVSSRNQQIPTPAALKGVPDTGTNKPATVISTSWGAQPVVFSPSPFSASVSKPAVGNTWTQSAPLASSNTFFKTSPASTTATDAVQPSRSLFLSGSSSSSPSFSSKDSEQPSSAGSGNIKQNLLSTSNQTNIPTSLKTTEPSSSIGAFNIPVNTTNTGSSGSLSFNFLSQTSTGNENVSLSNAKAAVTSSDMTFATLVSSSNLTITPVTTTPKSALKVKFNIEPQPTATSASLIPSQSSASVAPTVSAASNATSFSSLLQSKTVLSQQNADSTTTSQSAQSFSFGTNSLPKSTVFSSTSGNVFGNSNSSLAFGTTSNKNSSESPNQTTMTSNSTQFSNATSPATSSAANTDSSSSLTQPSSTIILKTSSASSASAQLTPSSASSSAPSLLSSSANTTTTISSSSPKTSDAHSGAANGTSASVLAGSPTNTVSSTFGGLPTFNSSFKSPNTSSQPFFSNTPSFNAATTSSSIFGSSSTPLFGGASKTGSAFGSLTTTTSAPTVFGGPAASTTAATTASTVFGSPATTPATTSLFGASTTTTTATPTIFGASTTTTAPTASIFGGSTTTTAATATIFGGSSTAAAATASIFGGSTTTTAPTGSIFGGSTTTTAPTGTIFGGSTTTTAPTDTIFGGSTTTTAPTGTIFGGSTTTTAPTATIFGGSTTTTAATTPLFGSTTTSSASIFGGSTTTAAATSTVFGSNTTTTASGTVFGSPSTTTTSTSVFGSPGAKSFFSATTTASSIFGGSSTFGSTTQSSNVFGAASALSSTSFFGSPTTTSSQAFGSASAASIFGGSSFGSTATTTSSSASFFGKPICSPTSTTANVFGSSGSVFGQAATTTAGSIFGGSTSFQQKSIFGQSGSMFGQTTTSSGTFGTSGGSIFGGTANFSSPTGQQGNLFQSGTSGGSIFGGGSSGGPFSNTQAGQTAFGAAASFQSPQRPFGSAAPAFGSPPSFGSAPTFGGSPTFGSSPNKVFGSQTAAAPAFGSPSQQSSNTFETLAQQETLSFGNLAQPQQQQQQQTFPSSSFAGSSFSSWR